MAFVIPQGPAGRARCVTLLALKINMQILDWFSAVARILMMIIIQIISFVKYFGKNDNRK